MDANKSTLCDMVGIITFYMFSPARRERVMTGDLPNDFLRFNASGGTPAGQTPGMVPVMYPGTFLPAQQIPTGRLSITVVQVYYNPS